MLRLAYYGVCVTLVAYYLWRIDVGRVAWPTLELLWLLPAVAVGLIHRVSLVLAWRSILAALGSRPEVSTRSLVRSYAAAWLARYVPGKVAGWLARVHFTAQVGVSRPIATAALVVEAVQQTLLALVAGMVAVTVSGQLPVSRPLLLVTIVGCTAVALVALHPRALAMLATRLQARRAGMGVAGPALPPLPILARPAAAQCLAIGLASLGHLCLLQAVFPAATPAEMAYTVGVSLLASVSGLLVPFAPSGLGIREGVQLALLPAVLGNGAAIGLTILARLWTTVVDVSFALFAIDEGDTEATRTSY